MTSFISLVLLCTHAWAEYRVFEFKIEDTRTRKSRRILSTLDPWQYPTYYPLAASEKLTWVDHWMCWRRQDPFTPLCERPGRELDLKSESAEPES